MDFPPRSPFPRRPIQVILDNIRSAYNVGSIFRTSDAAGVGHIHVCGFTPPPTNRKVCKTALGATEHVHTTTYGCTEEAILLLQAQGVQVVAAEVAGGAVDYLDFGWRFPVAIVLGNEVTGVHEDIRRICDGVVMVPMEGFKNAINVAVTAGILLYELRRRSTAGRRP